MFYFYLIECKYNEGTELNLIDMEKALATSFASALDDCDDLNRPIYALEVSSRHEYSEGSKFS